MHVLSGPGHHAVRRWTAQAVLALVLIPLAPAPRAPWGPRGCGGWPGGGSLALVLITLAPAAGVLWVLWVMVGSSVLIASAALLAIWPAEHRGDAPQTRASRPNDGGSHEQSHHDR